MKINDGYRFRGKEYPSANHHIIFQSCSGRTDKWAVLNHLMSFRHRADGRHEFFRDTLKKEGCLDVSRKVYLSKKTDFLVILIITAAFLCVCAGVLAMPEISIEGAKNGLKFSFGVLIPSLFPFMFLSDFAVEYGISSKLSKILAPFSEKLLYLPSEAGVTVLLSLIGGFPVGAVGINGLLKQNKITQSQANRMICFCVNSGPAFMISVVGAELYNNILLGAVLLAAQILSSLAIGITLGAFARRKEPLQRSITSGSNSHEFAHSFIHSCRNACSATINLCALVVLFSCFSKILLTALRCNDDSTLGVTINAVLEVTSGCNLLAGSGMPIYVTSLAIGWGGLCVHFQVFSSAELLRINKLHFCLARVVNGTLSALITFFITKFIIVETEVFSNIAETASSFTSSTFYGSLALFCASVIFLIFMNKYIKGIIKYNSSDTKEAT